MNDGNEWRDVCHDGNDLFEQDWSITEAMVACRQLGYPGTAMSRKGGYGNGNSSQTMDGVACFGSKYFAVYTYIYCIQHHRWKYSLSCWNMI